MESEYEQARLEKARLKNLEYLERLDSGKRKAPEDSTGNNKRRAKVLPCNVYVTGLTTYKSCKRLEALTNRIGKVKRLKFYSSDTGGVKGDALVTFCGSTTTLDDAIAHMNNFEILPGKHITATKAEFKAEKPPVVVSDHEKADAKCPVDYEKMSTHVLLYGLRKVADLKRKISEKTNRYGKVQTIRIEETHVLVVFQHPVDAIQCVKDMNGSAWEGRAVGAEFDLETIEQGLDEDTKLEAFLASLE